MIGRFRIPKVIYPFFIIILFSCCSKDEDDSHHSDGDVQVIFENDPVSGINIIFMGDAYTKTSLEKEKGKYYIHGINTIEALFRTSPFSEYKEHFNAYIIYAESVDMRTSTSNITTNTKFGSIESTHGSTGLTTLIVPDQKKINEYVFLVTSKTRSNRDVVLMSVNNADRGSARTNQNLAISGNADTRIMIHELGHAFSGLADEYFFDGNLVGYNSVAIQPDNLDVTDDLRSIKWNQFIGLEGYSDVGAHEGGGYNQFDIWRPENNSIMKALNNGNFNAPSRESIARKIMSLRNRNFDFDKFLEIDRLSMSNKNLKHIQVNYNTPELNFVCDLDLH